MPVVVSDLTGNDAHAAADLAALLQRLVVPESWQAGGGRGTVEVTPDVLRITQTGHVHYQIIVFCEKLRVARGLPTKSQDPKKFVLTTRTARAKAILGQMARVNVSGRGRWQASSLCSSSRREQRFSSTVPRWQRSGISENATGNSSSSPISFHRATPCGSCSNRWGWPGGPWMPRRLPVTTQKALAARMELEFYPVGKLPAGQPPAALIKRIKAELHGIPWGEGGG